MIVDHFRPVFKWYDRIKFPEEIDRDKCLRMIILLFDPGSPLHAVDSLEERGYMAAQLSYVPSNPENDTYPDWVKQVISLQNTQFNMAVMYYLSMIENTKVATLKAMKVAQLTVAAKLLAGDTKAVTELVVIEKEVDRRYNELFRGYNVSPKQWLDIDQFLIDEELDLSPEAMAQIREDHNKIFPQYDVFR